MRSAETNSINCWTSRPPASHGSMPHNSAPAAASEATRSRGPTAPALLVVATANAGKLREISALLADLPFKVVSQAALGVDSPEETGASFLDNALLKAR